MRRGAHESKHEAHSTGSANTQNSQPRAPVAQNGEAGGGNAQPHHSHLVIKLPGHSQQG